MKQVIQGLDGVGVYIDDLLVTGETIEKHDWRNTVSETNVISFNPLWNSWDNTLMLRECI